jgi:FAD/FMN-containing dehydrogenase
MLTMFRVQVGRQLTRLKVDRFAARFHGLVLRPGDMDYDLVRMLLGGWGDEYPALIACCTDVEDVRRALDFAWQHGLQIAVRGGQGTVDLASGDGALVIDRSSLVEMVIGPDALTAKVGVGLHPDDRDAALRMQGLTIDYRLSVEVVLADGRCLRATEDSHAELFRAALSGGDVGVVTAFEYRLRPIA